MRTPKVRKTALRQINVVRSGGLAQVCRRLVKCEGQTSCRAVTVPIITSECPTMYLVPA